MPNHVFGSMDVSGDREFGNHKYLGIFMATQSGMDAIFKQLRKGGIRIEDIKRKRRRRKALACINFDNNECLAFCIRIDRDPIVSRVKQMRMLRKTSEGKIRITYHRILFYILGNRMERFVLKHGVAITDVRFQCDIDCKNFIRDVGMRKDRVGSVHVIADIIAWANNVGVEPREVISLDLASDLERELVRQLAG